MHPASHFAVVPEPSGREPSHAAVGATGDETKAQNHGVQVAGDLNAAIARAVVRIYLDHVSRGPAKAQSFFRHDVVAVVLRDVLTRTERTLIAQGRSAAVSRLRQELQAAMRPSLVSAIEELTAGEVTACLADTDVEAGVACVTFILARSLDVDDAQRALQLERAGR
jgi:uncharacterized protein YbcI